MTPKDYFAREAAAVLAFVAAIVSSAWLGAVLVS